MAKTTKPLSLDDFSSENLLNDEEELEILDPTEEEEEVEEEEQEEEGEEEPASKKKKKKKTTTIVEEEEEEDAPKPKGKKKAKKSDPEPEPEEEPAGEEEEEEGEIEGEEEEEASEDSTKFFAEVEKITGVPLEVDYGKVDPLTPQGVALREKALGEKVLDNFLENLKDDHPQLFKAFQYAYAGGNIEELFQKATQRDYSKLEIKEGDDEVARQVLKEYYQSRGVKSEAKISKLITTDEESEEGLIKSAQAVAKEMGDAQATEQATKLQRQQQEAAAQKRKDQAFIQSIAEIVDKGVIDTFKLTGKREIEDFKAYVVENIERTQDGYAFRIDIDAKNLPKLLQSEYFRFKGGDLSKLIQIKASTEATNRLKLRLEQDKKKARGSSSETEETDSGKLSLRSFDR